ncbi:putative germin-like protein 9-2 [Ricinus communis]|uniref:Germin-like protein n=1 Tax=Ricinus communis TaxID=3988 RepID=B9SZ07_RICCO|nr:putative germin-like protein 9-2 [Ricinus communis]EEF31162.1 Rhicadhesin receptor precursor, putative [Ricinus communis]|eukprot:XP_002531226.1 putative germin-like protein 9-2 [Ricinus communis]
MGKFCSLIAFATILALANYSFLANARDPDILKDFLIPIGIDPSNITSQFFTYTGFRQLVNVNITGRTAALVTKASMVEFPALEGQGVSVAALIYPPSGINPPHVHPRASELLIVIQGVLEVGIIDSTNKLYTQTLQVPDMFIFPKGLVHYQINTRSDSPAYALGMFGSANAGTVSLPSSVFGSGISAEILAEAFKTDVETISKLIAANNITLS